MLKRMLGLLIDRSKIVYFFKTVVKMKTSNPILTGKAFRVNARDLPQDELMTVKGTATKALVLMMLVVASASWIWQLSTPQHALAFLFPAAIGGFLCALATTFKPSWAPITAPCYALLEGLVLGSTSVYFESIFPGIAFQATTLTLGTFVIMFLIYSSGAIAVNEKLRTGIIAATGGIALVYIISMLCRFFGISVGMIHGNSPLSIGFSLLVVGVAAFNLLLDFDRIEQGQRYGAPKYMEWYGAFGLLVTLIWLYVEILHLLSKIRGRK